jgi:hypothetical protein
MLSVQQLNNLRENKSSVEPGGNGHCGSTVPCLLLKKANSVDSPALPLSRQK